MPLYYLSRHDGINAALTTYAISIIFYAQTSPLATPLFIFARDATATADVATRVAYSRLRLFVAAATATSFTVLRPCLSEVRVNYAFVQYADVHAAATVHYHDATLIARDMPHCDVIIYGG